MKDLDAVVVPVSGGGMISGVATAAKALRPDITIIAAEPTGQMWRGASAWATNLQLSHHCMLQLIMLVAT